MLFFSKCFFTAEKTETLAAKTANFLARMQTINFHCSSAHFWTLQKWNTCLETKAAAWPTAEKFSRRTSPCDTEQSVPSPLQGSDTLWSQLLHVSRPHSTPLWDTSVAYKKFWLPSSISTSEEISFLQKMDSDADVTFNHTKRNATT